MDEEIHPNDLKTLAAGFPTSFIKMGIVSSAQGKVLPMRNLNNTPFDLVQCSNIYVTVKEKYQDMIFLDTHHKKRQQNSLSQYFFCHVVLAASPLVAAAVFY